MDVRVTRIDLERLGSNMILIRQWREGWNRDDAGAPDREDVVENKTISTLLGEYEAQGFTVEMAHAGVGRALRGQITRIDVVLIDGAWKVRKYPFGWSARTRPIEEKTISEEQLPTIIHWFQEKGWTLREWPGGYRGFRGAPKPVRDRAGIQAMRRNAKQQQLNTRCDFAFDF